MIDISKLSEEELLKILLTPDGKGRQVKCAALDELLERSTDKLYYDMRESLG
jgi:hypothetical protein